MRSAGTGLSVLLFRSLCGGVEKRNYPLNKTAKIISFNMWLCVSFCCLLCLIYPWLIPAVAWSALSGATLAVATLSHGFRFAVATLRLNPLPAVALLLSVWCYCIAVAVIV